MSLKIILIRHGESIANVNPSYYRYPDPVIVLSEKGVQQCLQLRDKFPYRFSNELKNATIISSMLSRARSTADIVTSRLSNVDIKRDARINECPTVFIGSNTEMESIDSVRSRVLSLVNEYDNGTHLFLFTHGELMWCIDEHNPLPQNCEFRVYDRREFITNYLSTKNSRRIIVAKN